VGAEIFHVDRIQTDNKAEISFFNALLTHQKVDYKGNTHEQESTSYWTSLFLPDLRADRMNQNGRNIRLEMPD
jgi:hypothetical protein